MELTLLISLPFGLAFIIGAVALPRGVRAGVAAGCCALIGLALAGYFPAVQAEALQRGGLLRALALPGGIEVIWLLDGLALLVASLIAWGYGLALLAAGWLLPDDAAGRRTLAGLLALVGALLGGVLAGQSGLWVAFGLLAGVLAAGLLRAPGLLLLAALSAAALLAGLLRLADTAATLPGILAPVTALAPLIKLEVSKQPETAALIVLILAGLGGLSLAPLLWSIRYPRLALGLVQSGWLLVGLYGVLRLYPPLHAHPWWFMLLVSSGTLGWLAGAGGALLAASAPGRLTGFALSTFGGALALVALPDYRGLAAALALLLAQMVHHLAFWLLPTTPLDRWGRWLLAASLAGVPGLLGGAALAALWGVWLADTPHALLLVILLVGAALRTAAALRLAAAPGAAAVHAPWQRGLARLLALLAAGGGLLLVTVLQPVWTSALPKQAALPLLPAFGSAAPGLMLAALLVGGLWAALLATPASRPSS